MRTRLLVPIALLALTACNRSPAAPAPVADAQRPLPPPERPNDVVLEAHFGHPRTTVAQAGRMVGMPMASMMFEPALARVMGIDAGVLSTCDTARPMDLVVSGSGEHPDLVLVLTPVATGEFRSMLSSRYRMVPVAGVGERLEPREAAPSPRSEGMHCVVTGVPDPATPSRVVCGPSDEAVAHAGRYAAYLSARHANEAGDAVLELDGASARAQLLPTVHQLFQAGLQHLSSTAAEQRRAHGAPPDLGDPEAVVAMLTEFDRGLDAQAADLRKLTVHLTLEPRQLVLETDATLDAAGHSGLVRDALARTTAPTSHPLAARLAPDSFLAVVAQSSPEERRASVSDVLTTLLRTLGDRVPDATAARADLDALFAQSAGEAAAGLAGPLEGAESVLLFAQADQGANARSVLARMARAPWLRGTRLGAGVVSAALRGDVLVLTPPPAGRAAGGAGASAGSAQRPSAVALGVVDGALAIAVGARPEAALTALHLRASGPTPALLAEAPETALAGAFDPSVLRPGSTLHTPVRFGYSAAREGDAVTGHSRIVIPATAIAALRGASAPSAPPAPATPGSLLRPGNGPVF